MNSFIFEVIKPLRNNLFPKANRSTNPITTTIPRIPEAFSVEDMIEISSDPYRLKY